MWWRDGVIYQCYPRSFADSDGDGVGDLRGIAGRLDYLAWLGVDGIWLNPINPSPNVDWGFDVSDYCDVHPDLGTLADLDALVAAAREHGIRVLLDLVPGHTSTAHPWFRAHPDYYVRAPGRDGGPPNNWKSMFGGPAWKHDPERGDWYLHNFYEQQADLDWWNEDVRDAFDAILTFWTDRGIAGFRIDVAHGIVKDRELRDNPSAGPEDSPVAQWLGQKVEFNMNRPEVHDVYRRWRALMQARGGEVPILMGETWVHDIPTLQTFLGDGDDELQLAFNFPFVEGPLDPAAMSAVVAETEALFGDGWPVWFGGNHDLMRFPDRWAHGDARLSRLALMLLLTLRGTPILYYGDELAMRETVVPPERELDPVALLRDPDRPGRDGARTPMPWSAEPGAGFTEPGVEPWLPFGDLAVNVADQQADRGSALWLVHDLIALRRARADLASGDYAQRAAPAGAWVWQRGAGTLVALNFGAEPVEVAASGEVLVGTDRARDREAVRGALRLGPAEGVVVAAG
ncbi:MAG: alpha-amylase family glycosyl hydrolase [Solirubrobacteraceae bacterium]